MQFNISSVIYMSIVCTRISLVCHLYVTRMYPYSIRMSFACHPYVTRISLVCHPYVTRMFSMSPVCHSHVLVCHSYVTRMYSYVTRMTLVCVFTMNRSEVHSLLIPFSKQCMKLKQVSNFDLFDTFAPIDTCVTK